MVRKMRYIPSVKSRGLLTLAAIFLLLQSVGIFLYDKAAHATAVVTVSPDTMNGWAKIDYNGQGGSLSYVHGLAKIGTGSAQFKTTHALQMYGLQTSHYNGTKLANLSALSYDTYVQQGNHMFAPVLQLDIDKDVDDGDTAEQGHLVYVPYQNGSIIDATWQTQNGLGGKWSFTDAALFDNNCSQAVPCTLSDIKNLYPNMGIRIGGSGLGFAAGNGWGTSFIGNIDAFTINNDIYDFESAASPILSSPANNAFVSNAVLVNTWQPSSGAARYIYESYNDAAATSVRVTDTTTDTSQSTTDIANGTMLWWRVKAVDAEGNAGAWSDLWQVTIDRTAPLTPTGGAPHGTTIVTNNFYFTWNSSTDNQTAVGYEFRFSQDASQVGTAPDNSSAWMSSVLSDPTLHSTGASDGIWYWQVRAVDGAGNRSLWSEVWNVTLNTAPSPVAPTVIIDDGTAGRMITGTVSDPAAVFEVKIDGEVRSDMIVVIGEKEGDMYTWKVSLPNDIPEGTLFEVAIKVTKDGQTSAEVTKTFIVTRAIGGGATIAGDGFLLEQFVANLQQPFALPGSFSESVTSGAISTTDALDVTDIPVAGMQEPLTNNTGDDTLAIAPSNEGWKIFGTALYWWLLLIGSLGMISWRMAVALKRRSGAISELEAGEY